MQLIPSQLIKLILTQECSLLLKCELNNNDNKNATNKH